MLKRHGITLRALNRGIFHNRSYSKKLHAQLSVANLTLPKNLLHLMLVCMVMNLWTDVYMARAHVAGQMPSQLYVGAVGTVCVGGTVVCHTINQCTCTCLLSPHSMQGNSLPLATPSSHPISISCHAEIWTTCCNSAIQYAVSRGFPPQCYPNCK